MTKKVAFSILILVLFFSHKTMAMSGCSSVNVGPTTCTYKVIMSGNFVAWHFLVTGGTIVTQSQSGTTYTADISFNTPGAQTVKFAANGNTIYDTYNVTVSACPGTPSTSNASRCGDGVVTLTASTNSFSVVRWYDGSGTYLATGNSFTTPWLSTSTIYKADAYYAAGSCASAKVNVTATVNAAPGALGTASASPSSFCGTRSVTLSATGAVAGENYVWTDAANNPVSSPVTLSASTSLWVARQSTANWCVGPKMNVNITVDTTPNVYAVGGGGSYCLSDPSPLVTLSGSQTAIKYVASRAGTSYPPVQGTGGALSWSGLPAGTYTITGFSQNSICSQVMTGTATITADPLPVGGTVSPATTYAYGVATGTLTLSGHTGTVVDWEQFNGSTWDLIGGTVGRTTYAYTNLSASKNYRVQVRSGSCPDAHSASATITVYSNPNVTATQTVIAYGNTVTLSAVGTFATYQWILNGTDIPGKTQNTCVVNMPGTYSLRVTGGSGAPPQTTGGLVISSAASKRLNLESTTVIRTEGVKPSTSLFTLGADKLRQTVTYSDGMGRPEQVVAVGASPAGRDMIQYVEYSNYGLSEKQYLPYVSLTMSDGQKKTNPVNDQSAFYALGGDLAKSSAPYAVSKLAASPLANLREQGAPGTDWQPGAHSVKTDFVMNTANQVRYWKPDGTTNSYYVANTLAVSQITDENGNMVRTFIDKLGNPVLKQVQLDETVETRSTPWLETYYVYDGFGKLIYQLPPKAMALLGTGASLTATNATVAELIYKYTYDVFGRLTQKKVPNAVAQYIVYDLYDRPVLMQDGNLRSTNEWFFMKYDSRDRVVMTGRFLDATHTTLATMQDYVTPATPTGLPMFEEEGTTLQGYTNVSFPITNYGSTALLVHAVNYYDHYDFNRDGTADYAYTIQNLTGEKPVALFVEGKSTGHKTLVEGTSTWLTSVAFYDAYGHVIQQKSNNHLSTAVDNVTTAVYDMEGKVLITKTQHNGGGTNQLSILARYIYDAAGRITNVYQTVPGGAEQLVARYAYNELGQLVDKKLHNTTTSTFLQSVDYRYNERGWLISINNAQLNGTDVDAAPDYFGMEMLYEKTETGLNDQSGDKTYWNGNISATKWKNFGSATGVADQRSYKYQYDKSDKLKAATFQANSGTNWTAASSTLNEQMTYDVNGNILTLQRNTILRSLSGTAVINTPQLIDNLTYTYKSSTNTLQKVEDATANAAGFANGSNVADEYLYTADGSLKGDLNKGIGTTGIVYNVLGKPKTITYTDGRKVDYTYDLDGNKLTVKSYAAGSSTPASTTDYVGGFVYVNGTLSYFSSPEGRVVKKGSVYEYQYVIGDRQGNTRLLFSSATPAPAASTATFEGDANDNASQFSSVVAANVVSSVAANHTTSGTKVVRMNQTYKIGPAKSMKVFPGDKVDLEVWEYHEGSSGFGTTSTPSTTLINLISGVFGGVSGGLGESGLIYTGVNSAVTGFLPNGTLGDSRPAAYLNYILFDANYKVLDMGWQPAPAATFTKQKISFPTFNIKVAGYMFTYLSYDDDSNNWVYFDDLKITHTQTNVIQNNEYYPYGLQTASSWTREGNSNNFLYNGGTEQNTTTVLYDLAFRTFDPALGRFHQVDPLASKYSSQTPYSYANGNPAVLNDPSGLEVPSQGGCGWCMFNPNIRDANYSPTNSSSSGGQMYSPHMVDVGYGTLNLTTGQVLVTGARTFRGDMISGNLDAFTEANRARRQAAAGDVAALNAYVDRYGSYGRIIDYYNVSGGEWGDYIETDVWFTDDAGLPRRFSFSDPNLKNQQSSFLTEQGFSSGGSMASTLGLAATLALTDGPLPIGDILAIGVVSWALVIHANSRNSPKPNIVYELWSYNSLTGYQTMKYGISSRADFVTRSGNPRPEYQAVALNLSQPFGSSSFFWYTIVARTPDRASALAMELQLVQTYMLTHGGIRPPLQIKP